MKEIIKQAATVEQAIELALEEMGLPREQVTAEVLEYPEKKLFFKKPAKVKVVQIEDAFDVKTMFETKKEEPKKEPQKQQPKKEAAKAPKSAEKTEQAVAPKTTEQENAEPGLQEISLENSSEKTKYAIEFIKSMIGQFYTGEYSFKIYQTQTGAIIKIMGEDAGVLIGRKGETMEAISYLTSLAANRFQDTEEKISVDVADYRQKREKDLQQMAKKMAIKVAKTGRPYTFEPMNPYERRIIHAMVGEMEGVRSESKGEGSQRRVVVYSTAPRKPRSNNNNNYRGGYNKNNRGGYNKDNRNFSKTPREKTEAPAQKTREEKLVDNAGTSLYSKIEL